MKICIQCDKVIDDDCLQCPYCDNQIISSETLTKQYSTWYTCNMRELRKRIHEKLAYRYWVKNKNLMAEECWQKAEKLLNYIDKRKMLMARLLK